MFALTIDINISHQCRVHAAFYSLPQLVENTAEQGSICNLIRLCNLSPSQYYQNAYSETFVIQI